MKRKILVLACVLLVAGIMLPPVPAGADSPGASGTTTVSGTLVSPLTIWDVALSLFVPHHHHPHITVPLHPSEANISWKTNRDATSEIYYDTQSRDEIGDYAWSVVDDEPVSEHSITLTGLSPSETYYFRVRSATPETRAEAISAEYSFRTRGQDWMQEEPSNGPDAGPVVTADEPSLRAATGKRMLGQLVQVAAGFLRRLEGLFSAK